MKVFLRTADRRLKTCYLQIRDGQLLLSDSNAPQATELYSFDLSSLHATSRFRRETGSDSKKNAEAHGHIKIANANGTGTRLFFVQDE